MSQAYGLKLHRESRAFFEAKAVHIIDQKRYSCFQIVRFYCYKNTFFFTWDGYFGTLRVNKKCAHVLRNVNINFGDLMP